MSFLSRRRHQPAPASSPPQTVQASADPSTTFWYIPWVGDWRTPEAPVQTIVFTPVEMNAALRAAIKEALLPPMQTMLPAGYGEPVKVGSSAVSVSWLSNLPPTQIDAIQQYTSYILPIVLDVLARYLNVPNPQAFVLGNQDSASKAFEQQLFDQNHWD